MGEMEGGQMLSNKRDIYSAWRTPYVHTNKRELKLYKGGGQRSNTWTSCVHMAARHKEKHWYRLSSIKFKINMTGQNILYCKMRGVLSTSLMAHADWNGRYDRACRICRWCGQKSERGKMRIFSRGRTG